MRSGWREILVAFPEHLFLFLRLPIARRLIFKQVSKCLQASFPVQTSDLSMPALLRDFCFAIFTCCGGSCCPLSSASA